MSQNLRAGLIFAPLLYREIGVGLGFKCLGWLKIRSIEGLGLRLRAAGLGGLGVWRGLWDQGCGLRV